MRTLSEQAKTQLFDLLDKNPDRVDVLMKAIEEDHIYGGAYCSEDRCVYGHVYNMKSHTNYFSDREKVQAHWRGLGYDHSALERELLIFPRSHYVHIRMCDPMNIIERQSEELKKSLHDAVAEYIAIRDAIDESKKGYVNDESMAIAG